MQIAKPNLPVGGAEAAKLVLCEGKMEQIYSHAYGLNDCRAEIVIKWSAPDGLAQDSWEAASEEAEKVLGEVWKRTQDIVNKMMPR